MLITGGARRDFHSLDVAFRDKPAHEVVAYTAAQIPSIEGRTYPAELAGKLCAEGVPIYPESQLDALVKDLAVGQVVVAHSDVPHEYAMHSASRVVAAKRFGAAEIVDPRRYMVGSNAATSAKCPDTGPVLPAMRYGSEQVREPGETSNATPCDLVIVATPIDLRRVVEIDRPSERVRRELQEIGLPALEEVLSRAFERGGSA